MKFENKILIVDTIAALITAISVFAMLFALFVHQLDDDSAMLCQHDADKNLVCARHNNE